MSAYSRRKYHFRAILWITVINLVNKTLVNKAHGVNLPVHAWTVNKVSDMKRVIALGVDGIITDYPSRLVNFVRPHG